VVEHPVYIGRVIGSIPIISTIKIKNGVVDKRYFALMKKSRAATLSRRELAM
jgi:hypothetical protein